VIRYLVQKYGKDHCAQIAAIQYRKAKAAIKDAARILGYPADLADSITKLIPTVAYDDDGNKETDLDIENSCAMILDLKRKRDIYPDIFDLAMALENLPKTSSTHAAGLLISPVTLVDQIPLVKGRTDDVLATSLNLDDAEKLFVKFDLLALSTLTVIDLTEKQTGIVFSYDNNKFNDPKVWRLINSKNTAGIFQISSSTYRRRMYRLRPQNIQELADCLALVRGPCISAGTDEDFMLIREGKRQRTLIHPVYDAVTERTNGILIYQEQTMQLAVRFGLSLSVGYRIVKAAAKKKLEELKQYREQFIAAAVMNGCPERTADIIFRLIERSSQYSFNQSHALSYAMLSYATAWFKVYYRDIFMANTLSDKYVNGTKQECTSTVNDCKNLKISFLPPDINNSSYVFTLENGSIRIGLCAVKGLGEKAATALLKTRQALGGHVNDLQQFLDNVEKKQFNRSKVIVSIFAGVFDSFLKHGETRRTLYEQYCSLSEQEPEDEVKIAKGYVINTKTRAFKGLQTQTLGAVFFDIKEDDDFE